MNELYIRQGRFLGRIVDIVVFLVIRYCTPTNLRNKWLTRLQDPNNQKIVDDVLYGSESGVSLVYCDYYFAYFCASYAMFFAWVLYSIIERYVSISFIAIASTVLVLGYIPCHLTVYRKNKYIKYFKQFKKKDASWHGKWRWVTIGFMLGGIFISILGFLYYAHNHIPII